MAVLNKPAPTESLRSYCSIYAWRNLVVKENASEILKSLCIHISEKCPRKATDEESLAR